MQDQSALDRKYFIDLDVYNCPFCKRGNVVYEGEGRASFDWSTTKGCCVYFIRCSSCKKRSMHLSYKNIVDETKKWFGSARFQFKKDVDIDSELFYSVPTSFFVVDKRIPGIIRELISEAEGCLKMNYLTGASACARKAIYELLVLEAVEGKEYDDRIKSLKKKHPEIDTSLFDILGHIQDMTSDKLHEQSWDKWESDHLKLIIADLQDVLYFIYVLPKEKEERSVRIKQLQESVKLGRKKGQDEGQEAPS